ncbi:hypothetical protein EDB84DRAFT_1521523 [Lactarius hengduanensis]|nr:hypothetical protein EDB84DRAFT_1521523 [Lactarius hengduanensis]
MPSRPQPSSVTSSRRPSCHRCRRSLLGSLCRRRCCPSCRCCQPSCRCWVVAVVVRCRDAVAIAVVFTAVVVESDTWSDTAPSAWSNRHQRRLAGSGVFGMLPASRWLSGPGAASEMSSSRVPVGASASAGNLQWMPSLSSSSMLSHASRFPKA